MREQEYHAHLHAPQAKQESGESSSDAPTSPQHEETTIQVTDDTNSNHRNSRRRRRSTTKVIRRTTKINHEVYARPGRHKQAWLSELFYGLTIYITCIFLPSFPYYIYQTYTWIRTWVQFFRERMLWSIYISWRFSLVIMERLGIMDDPYSTFVNNNYNTNTNTTKTATAPPTGIKKFGKKVSNYIFSTSTASLWEEFNQKHDQPTSNPINGPTPYTWGFGRTTTLFPAILMVMQDIQILVILAVLLAIIRVWCVHMLVPDVLAKPRRLEALTRCKSSHLLSSSSYSFGGVKGWDKAKERSGLRRVSVSGRYGAIGAVEGGENNNEIENRVPGYYERMLTWVSFHWYRLRPSVRRALGHEPSARYDAIVANGPQKPPLPSSASSYTYRRSNSTPNPTQQLFSAPRYATATFRLLYTSISTLTALVIFQSAEFWPTWLFGTGSTRHCWDLSGSFSALGFLDSDYDAKNGALKYFFLAQAAYQLHSLCFHIVSMLLLLLYGGSNDSTASGMPRTNSFAVFIDNKLNPFHRQREQTAKSQRLVSMKTSMQSYFRPMMEHCIVLCCLVGAYLFSGLRRLGAVGIFTLELSSVFLQLLQVCIYAPSNVFWSKPSVVIFVHRVLTVPTFIYCRLIVLPFILWRSALFESQEWLEQIEKVFSPGWAREIWLVFNLSLCLIFALNLILFRRLLFHPHLKQIVKQKRDRIDVNRH